MGTFCNITYLGPSKQMRAGGRLWEAGEVCLLPRVVAERFVSTYHLAEWKLEDVVEEVPEEAKPEPEKKSDPKPKGFKKSKKTKPEPEDLTTETFDEGSTEDDQENEEVE